MKAYKLFLLVIASGLAIAGLFLSPARAEAPPVLPGIVLDRGKIETQFDFSFFSGGKYFDENKTGREAPGGFQFSEGKSTLDLSYGLTNSLTLGLSLPVVHREYSGYVQTEEYLGECYSEGETISHTQTVIFKIPYNLHKTGIGDVTLEARYRLVNLSGSFPDLAARLAGKLRVGSNGVNFDQGQINLGDGQNDLYLGIAGQGAAPYLLYDFSLDYRLRFSGSYSLTMSEQTLNINSDPGDEFRARAGAYVDFRQLTLGVSGNYINIGKFRIWREGIIEGNMGSGYYFNLTPVAGVKLSPASSVSFSVEVPVVGKNYPVDSPSFLFLNLFDYRWNLNFQYRI